MRLTGEREFRRLPLPAVARCTTVDVPFTAKGKLGYLRSFACAPDALFELGTACALASRDEVSLESLASAYLQYDEIR
ncbi:hypothetical protein MRX96_020174 [Rhipicephalus microplus]